MNNEIMQLLKEMCESGLVNVSIHDEAGNSYSVKQYVRAMETASILDNTKESNFNPKVLYKAIIYTIDFAKHEVQEIITKATQGKAQKSLESIPITFLKPVLALNGGYYALSLIRYVEENFEEGYELVKTLIKKQYPRINKYVKVEHVIKDNYFDALQAVYGVNMQLPENRITYYLLACCLVDKFIPTRLSVVKSFSLEKFRYSILDMNLATQESLTEDKSFMHYEAINDNTGFYNADLGNVDCKLVPYREMVNLKPNTSAKELREALVKELDLNNKMWRDPYSVIFNEFKAKNNNILDYNNLPQFVKENELSVAHEDIVAVLNKNFIQVPESLPESCMAMVLDFTMRHMARHKYGVKKNIQEIRDYVGFVIQCIQNVGIERDHIIRNALQIGLEGNTYARDNRFLRNQISDIGTQLAVLEDKYAIANAERNEAQRELKAKENYSSILEDKIESKDKLIAELQEKLKAQESLNKELKQELEVKTATLNRLEEVEDNLLEVDVIKEKIQNLNIVLIGARPDFEAKVNEVLPFIKTISMTQAKQMKNTVNSATYCVMDTSYTSHPERYAVDELYKDKKFIYTTYGINNLKLWLNDIYQKLLAFDK